jgi:hypothetical protein
VRIETRRRQPGEAGLGELRAVQLEERRGNGVETEGIAFLQNNAGKLTPDLDDEGFGQVMLDSVLDHGADLPSPHRDGHEQMKGQWWRLPNPSQARANNDRAASIWREEFFRADALLRRSTYMTEE